MSSNNIIDVNSNECEHGSFHEAENDSYISECQQVSDINSPYSSPSELKNILSGILSPVKDKNLSVTFAQPSVTEVRTRPRTREKDKHKLFFTRQEYLLFRKAYRVFKEEQMRIETQSSSPLFHLLSFASNFISGLEVRQKKSSSLSGNEVVSAAAQKSTISTSDLYDILYLY